MYSQKSKTKSLSPLGRVSKPRILFADKHVLVPVAAQKLVRMPFSEDIV